MLSFIHYIKNIKYYNINMLERYNKSVNKYSNIITNSIYKKVILTFTTRNFKTSSKILPKPIVKKNRNVLFFLQFKKKKDNIWVK